MALTDYQLEDSDLLPFIDHSLRDIPDDNIRAGALLKHQLDPDIGWPRLIDNMRAFSQIENTIVNVAGIPINISLNITRTPSLTANTFEKSKDRPFAPNCFLCNLDKKQRGVLTLDDRYLILANPGVTIPGDLTIASVSHEKQLIAGHFSDMIKLAEKLYGYSIFFNGALAGASSPHFHFQAGVKDSLIGEGQLDSILRGNMPGDVQLIKLTDRDDPAVFLIENFLRPCFICDAKKAESLGHFFDFFQDILLQSNKKIAGIPNVPDFGQHIDSLDMIESEPRMNILLKYYPESGLYRAALFPKVYNRPSFYFNAGANQIILGMAIKEALGHLITCRKGDYDKLTQRPELVKRAYADTSLQYDEILFISNLIKRF